MPVCPHWACTVRFGHTKDVQKVLFLTSHLSNYPKDRTSKIFVVVVALLFYVHGKHLRSCRDGQLT